MKEFEDFLFLPVLISRGFNVNKILKIHSFKWSHGVTGNYVNIRSEFNLIFRKFNNKQYISNTMLAGNFNKTQTEIMEI